MSRSPHPLRRFVLDLLGAPFEFVRLVVTIVGSPRLLVPCIVPWVVGSVVFVIGLAYVDDIATWAANVSGATESAWLSHLVTAIGFGLGFVGVAIAAVAAVLVVGGVFFDFMVEELLRREHLLDEGERPLGERLRLIGLGLVDDVLQVLVLGALGAATVILGFFPPFLFIGGFLSLVAIGYELIDKPLALMNVRFRGRVAVARAHLIDVVSLGLVAAPLLVVPIVNFIALPVLYAFAVRRVARWHAAPIAARPEV